MMPRVWRPDQKLLDSFDRPRRRLADLVAEQQEDLSKLSRLCERNDSYLWQYFTRGKPRDLPEDVRMKLAEYFNVGEEEFRGERVARNGKKPGNATLRVVSQPALIAPSGKIPVVGRAMAGTDRILWESGTPQEWVDRPGYLPHSDAFAVYVNGDSMEDRYYAGEKVYIDPSKPLSRGCFVVVQCHDNSAIIKQFLRYTDDQVELQQLNPKKVILVPREKIRAIHRIVGSSEY